MNTNGQPRILKFATGNNNDRDAASVETGLGEFTDGVTQQQFADECDINTIVRRFGLTGEIPSNYRPPISGDFTEITDFQTAMNQVRAAQENFMQLPGKLRARFNNNPQNLLDFLSDDANRAEAELLGLVQKPTELDRTGQPAATPTEGAPKQ